MVILVSYLLDAYHFIAGCGILIYDFKIICFLPGMFGYFEFYVNFIIFFIISKFITLRFPKLAFVSFSAISEHITYPELRAVLWPCL